jgi:magnesium-transporting ATPase (P-type)
MATLPFQDPAQLWHALRPADVVAATASDHDAGLSPPEARRRLEEVGPNALREAEGRSMWAVFVGQFKSPLIYLLLGAAALALALGHRTDAIVIFVVVVLNAVIGALQEGRAERSLEALRRLASNQARVVRGGHQLVVPAREIVPGDIVILEAGDAVAADARVLDSTALQIAEAALTGESQPVAKERVPVAPDTPLADRRDMVYAGTHVTAGRARSVVVATGHATEIGHIAALAEGAREAPTPLERRIAQFGRYVIVGAGAMFALVLGIGLLRGLPLGEILMLGVSQLVGMIPEGLPVAMTIALAVGVQRMARRHAVVRRLAAVETLGSTTIICTDKTGTLTRNEMTATAIALPDGRELTVTGIGYAPSGAFRQDGRELDPARDAGLRALLEAGALCNDARLEGPEDAEPRWRPIGDPTEVALLVLAIKGGVVPDELRARMPRRAEIPFESAAQMMATQHDGHVIVKGAPEVVLELCRAARVGDADRLLEVELDEQVRRSIREAGLRMAARALRVLAVAVVDGAQIEGDAGFAAFRGRASLLGLVGQLDPPRTEAADAVERCRRAGIKPVMATGDHKETGQAIAAALDIAREGDGAVDGRELERMSDDELAARIDGISVFARVHPAQKLRIVQAYQRRREVVAMTGDGVNDAPALATADVGVAMGRTGTEVAKEAAKIVIADDNFATLVSAVEEGRIVYRNIKKAILLLFTTSAAEVLVLMTALLLGYPPPFAAVQILWNNLVTEGLITVNLVMEPAEGDEMGRPPIPTDEPLLDRVLLTRFAFIVPAIVISTLGWFLLRSSQGVPEALVRTETFTLLAICEWFNVLNCRSERRSALSLGVFRNPWLVGGILAGNALQAAVVFWEPLGRVFHTVPISLEVVIALGLVGSLVLWVEELRKLAVRRRLRRQQA